MKYRFPFFSQDKFMRSVLVQYWALLFLMAPVWVMGQSFVPKARLDSMLNILAANDKFMGAVSLRQGDNLVYEKAVGFSTLQDGKEIPSTVKTKYRIASTTKMFTAVMILQLIEEGHLSLTTPLSDFYPGIPNADAITIKDLLSHHSGIWDFTHASNYFEWNQTPQSEADMIQRISAAEPEFAPGKKGEYSNSNYLLLGYILEKVSKQSYAASLEARITQRLGLTSTYAGGAIDLKKGECQSFSYVDDHWEAAIETDLSVPGGAGAIVSTANDLAAFISGLFAGKLLKESTLAQMITIENEFGLGIFEAEFHGKKAYGHTGSIDEFRSRVYYFPDEKLSLAFTCNGYEYGLKTFTLGILGIYLGKPGPLPDFPNANVSVAQLEAVSGVYKHWLLPLKIHVYPGQSKLLVKQEGFGSMDPKATNFYAIGPYEYRSYRDGVTLRFSEKKPKLLVDQGGGNLKFKKRRDAQPAQ
jgi:D-alanyl-D-alanine carboxypeptidase